MELIQIYPPRYAFKGIGRVLKYTTCDTTSPLLKRSSERLVGEHPKHPLFGVRPLRVSSDGARIRLNQPCHV